MLTLLKFFFSYKRSLAVSCKCGVAGMGTPENSGEQPPSITYCLMSNMAAREPAAASTI